MAIEITPTTKTESSRWLHVSLYIFLTILLVFLLSYFILLFYQSRLAKELSSIERALERTPEERTLERELFSAQQRIGDFAFLMGEHRFPLRLFEFLESNTHPGVWFTEFELDSARDTMVVSGKAESFEALGQQNMILEGQSFIKSLDLSEASIDREGGVDFKLFLAFDAGFLK